MLSLFLPDRSKIPDVSDRPLSYIYMKCLCEEREAKGRCISERDQRVVPNTRSSQPQVTVRHTSGSDVSYIKNINLFVCLFLTNLCYCILGILKKELYHFAGFSDISLKITVTTHWLKGTVNPVNAYLMAVSLEGLFSKLPH